MNKEIIIVKISGQSYDTKKEGILFSHLAIKIHKKYYFLNFYCELDDNKKKYIQQIKVQRDLVENAKTIENIKTVGFTTFNSNCILNIANYLLSFYTFDKIFWDDYKFFTKLVSEISNQETTIPEFAEEYKTKFVRISFDYDINYFKNVSAEFQDIFNFIFEKNKTQKKISEKNISCFLM